MQVKLARRLQDSAKLHEAACHHGEVGHHVARAEEGSKGLDEADQVGGDAALLGPGLRQLLQRRLGGFVPPPAILERPDLSLRLGVVLLEEHVYEVQALAAELLRAMGYFVTWEAPKGKDGGIDIIAFRDPLGAQPPRIKVQVKRTAEAVAVEGLRSFLALIGDGDIGLFVSTGGFTRDAREEARRQESRQVTLVDAPEFYGLWARHYEKLSERAKRTFPLRPIWFLAPEE